MSPSSAKSPRRRDHTPDPKALGSVLDELASGRPWSSGIALGELGRRWEGVVGGRLAVECLPAALEGGVLIVRASSAAWGAQIRFLEAEIRDRANRALGRPLVQELRVTIDGGGAERSR